MSSDTSTRMSLRPRRSGKFVFEVGDVVEVSYRNGIELGNLICKVNSDKWIVKYKNNNLHEQQVSEKAFGRLLKRSKPASSSVINNNRKRSLSQKRCTNDSDLPDVSSKGSEGSSSAKKLRNGKKIRKSHKEIKDIAPNITKTNEKGDKNDVKDRKIRKEKSGTDEISIKAEKNNETCADSNEPVDESQLSSREKRLRMRQEAVEADLDVQNIEVSPKKENNKSKGKNKTPNKRASTWGRNSKQPKEEVVKVKMNTGTLYMYRGSNPRAVFVRTY